MPFLQVPCARRYSNQVAMRDLQQARGQRLPSSLLRTGNMRIMYAIGPYKLAHYILVLTLRQGQSNLPASCPVCEHSPLSAEDCNPNKSLRTTIRVFLRTAEKKREASRPKEDKDSEPATPVEAPKQNLPTTETSAIETPIEQISGVDAPSSVQVDSADKVDEGAPAPHVVQVLKFPILVKDLPLTFFKESITHHDDTPATESPRQVEAGDAQSAPAEGSTEDAPIEHSDEQTLTTQNGEGGINGAGEENEQQMDAENDEDQDQEKPDSESMNGNFPNGSFSSSGDFNQMQMMMAMQNGMTPNSFGGFPMMGKFVK